LAGGIPGPSVEHPADLCPEGGVEARSIGLWLGELVDQIELVRAADAHANHGLDPISVGLSDELSIAVAPPLEVLVNFGSERARDVSKDRFDLESLSRIPAEIVDLVG
jgi:hypothetical protein